MTKYIGFKGFPNEQIWDSEKRQITWTNYSDLIVKDVGINTGSKHWRKVNESDLYFK
jgi:hypothetical protein